MDTFWLYFLVVLSNFSIWITSVYAQGRCHHPCTGAGNCNVAFTQNRCWYVYKDKLRSWDESKQHCGAQGLQMIKIDNENVTRVIIRDLLSNLPDGVTRSRNPAWLGGRARNYDNWNFLDGTPVDVSKLDIFYPLPFIGWQSLNDCGCFLPYTSHFSIGVQGCYIKGNFICRKDDCHMPAIQDCLIFSEEKKTWFEARSRCKDMGGDLFYLKEDENPSQFELYAGSSLYNKIRYASLNVYIGMVHRQWIWHDDMSIFHTNWEEGEPNNYDQGCLIMHDFTGKWHDHNCDTKFETLCQAEITSTTRSTTQQTVATSSQIGLTTPNQTAPGQSTTSSSTAADDSKGNGTAIKNRNNIIIILGSFLGLALVLVIVITVICWRRGKKRNPQGKNNVTASRHDIPENQSPTTDTYDYINCDEVPEKRPETTVRYQNVNSNDIP